MLSTINTIPYCYDIDVVGMPAQSFTINIEEYITIDCGVLKGAHPPTLRDSGNISYPTLH